VDCFPYPNQGCNAGWVSVAFNFKRDYGIASKESYPYKPENGECRWDRRKSTGTLREYVTLTSNDERELAKVVYKIGPVAVSIDHLHEEFDQYFGGILRTPSCRNTNYDLKHSVLLVGFETHPKWGDYWIIKNSYGTEWGESGYFKLARNCEQHVWGGNPSPISCNLTINVSHTLKKLSCSFFK